MLHEIIKPGFHSGIIYHQNLEKLKKDFFKMFTTVEAAGGLVENDKGEWLLIHRRGYWDLPKGKIDKGETPEQASVREVEEETGLKKIKRNKLINTTFHTYHEFGKFILKPTYWFSMKTNGSQELKPQTTEDITEVKWVKKTDASAYFASMYPSVRDVINAASK
jgi:8-oxo-dGTP pyrophosphatase MutT (NUDIX family)